MKDVVPGDLMDQVSVCIVHVAVATADFAEKMRVQFTPTGAVGIPGCISKMGCSDFQCAAHAWAGTDAKEPESSAEHAKRLPRDYPYAGARR